MAMSDGLRQHPLMLAALLAVGMSGCLPFANSGPEYGTSGFDALDGLGQRMTDTMLDQATHRDLHDAVRMDTASPIQMTGFVNLDGSAAGRRFGHLIAERMAQRLTERGYVVTRATPPEEVLKTAFPKTPAPDTELP